MTRSDALDIIDDLPRSLSDIATKTETDGVDFMIDQLGQVGIDGEAFLKALKDDLIESLSEYPLAQDSLKEQLGEAFGSEPSEDDTSEDGTDDDFRQQVADRFKDIAESADEGTCSPMYSPDDEYYGERIDERMS